MFKNCTRICQLLHNYEKYIAKINCEFQEAGKSDLLFALKYKKLKHNT